MDLPDKPFSQSCENNKAPILAVLTRLTKTCQTLLEVGSGTGQHAVHFAKHLPHVSWQTSDRPQYHAGIQQWLDEAGLSNAKAPIELDVRHYPWRKSQFDVVFTANTLHIMSREDAEYFVLNVAKSLQPSGRFIAYGPFNYGGKFTSESNARFEVWLKQQNPFSGIRDFEALADQAEAGGMRLLEDIKMPANNRILVWEKVVG